MTLLCGVSLAIPASAHDLELKADSFTLVFGADGRPASAIRTADGIDLVHRRHGDEGFSLRRPDGTVTRLGRLTLDAAGTLTAATADGTRQVHLNIRRGPRSITLRIIATEGIRPDDFESLHFRVMGDPRLRVLALDFMTLADSRPYGVFVDWPEFWHRAPENPLGGFVLYETTSEDDEDETLLQLWIAEDLPRPKSPGIWNEERARDWLREWQARFADRTQMILAGRTLPELREGLDVAARAGVKQIYLFTDVWRPDPFWPVRETISEVNRHAFPRGEDDLRAFADEVRGRGMYLALHSLSGGIGMRDPIYVGTRPSRRLASWGSGTLAQPLGSADTEALFQPEPGLKPPGERAPPYFRHSQWNWMRIGDEIVQIGAIEPQADGTWRLARLQRARGSTLSAAHPRGQDAAGLFASYGQAFTPGNDTPLLVEIAETYAGLLNRCRIEHVEFDGAEIHAHEGFWGYRKFATRLYEALDHPTTAHDSSGSRPWAWFEYQFNSSKRLMRGSCAYTHGNYTVPVALASPSRPATTLLDAHFSLSQGHLGGALGIAKPEPMFGVSIGSLKAHGLTDAFLDALATWKEVCSRLTPDEHARLDALFEAPSGDRRLRFNHHLQSWVVPVARRRNDSFEIMPTRVLTRRAGDVPWQNGQEHGPISPRQFLAPGETITLHNPDAAQPPRFILQVLPAFDIDAAIGEGRPTTGSPPVGTTAADTFTRGNDGPTAAANGGPVANLTLMPSGPQAIRPGGATSAALEGAGLVLTANNPHDEVVREVDALPSWGVAADLSARRGLGLWVTGDGSGATLLVQVGSRDYVVPIDFTGRRCIEIPNGEVSWARGDWGWRMETKANDYAAVRRVKVGFGQLPPRSSARVVVERLTALGEIPAMLVNPVVRINERPLRVTGAIPSGRFIEYTSGDAATLFDENWNVIGSVPVEPGDCIVESGDVSVAIESGSPGPAPWLALQVIATGEPMLVGESRPVAAPLSPFPAGAPRR